MRRDGGIFHDDGNDVAKRLRKVLMQLETLETTQKKGMIVHIIVETEDEWEQEFHGEELEEGRMTEA